MTPATPADVEETQSGSRRTPVLLGLVLTMGLAAMDTTSVSTAVPQSTGPVSGAAGE